MWNRWWLYHSSNSIPCLMFFCCVSMWIEYRSGIWSELQQSLLGWTTASVSIPEQLVLVGLRAGAALGTTVSAHEADFCYATGLCCLPLLMLAQKDLYQVLTKKQAPHFFTIISCKKIRYFKTFLHIHSLDNVECDPWKIVHQTHFVEVLYLPKCQGSSFLGEKVGQTVTHVRNNNIVTKFTWCFSIGVMHNWISSLVNPSEADTVNQTC